MPDALGQVKPYSGIIKVEIRSSDAIILYFLLMFAAYMATVLWPNLPFLAFATQITIALGAILTKRHFKDKLATEGGEGENNFRITPPGQRPGGVD